MCEAVEKGETLNLVPDQARHGTRRDLATPGERKELTKEEKLALACTELPQAGTVVLGWRTQPAVLQKLPRLPASNSATTVDTTRAHPGGRLLPNLCLRDPTTSGSTCVIQASASAASQRDTQTPWAARQDSLSSDHGPLADGL